MSRMRDVNANLVDVVRASTLFITSCYGRSNNILETRYDIWNTKMIKKKQFHAETKVTSSDVKGIFAKYLQSTCICKNAPLCDPREMDPENYGWIKNEASQTYMPITVPDEFLLALFQCSCSTDEPGSSRYGSVKAHLSYTIFANVKLNHIEKMTIQNLQIFLPMKMEMMTLIVKYFILCDVVY